MNDRNRSEFIANVEWVDLQPKAVPTWALPSRCKRPPLKPAPRPSPFERLLSLLGVK